MGKSGAKAYRRLDKADRVAIENGLDKGKSCRRMAEELGRSPSTVADEVARNRSVSRGPDKGGRAGEPPEGACPRLTSWPRCCNGCRLRRYHCSKAWRCEYSAARAQAMADEELSASRMGVDRGEAEFELMMAAIRGDVARGLSPAQIAASRAAQFRVSASTIYRLIERGYAGMSSLELRRKCGYKRRSRAAGPKATAHGEARSFGAFMGLPEEERAAACEMDTVVGLKSDRRCLLTLYQRPCKFQLALLMPGKDCGSTSDRLDALEKAVGKAAFSRMFGLVLTDNGAEFSDCAAIERSALPGAAKRCSVYYCDARQSQQKGGCERNHVELRKILPKGRGISFDRLSGPDCAVLMSHLNSEPRPSLGGMCAIDMLLAAYGDDGRALLDALGIEKVPYGGLLMSPAAIERARRGRGEGPLVP